MVKYFYKKQRDVPTFFDRRLKVRSTAYGEEVKREFAEWRAAFYKGWNGKLDNMLICEQGDIGGNAVRADGLNAYIVDSDAVEYESNSVLPPLWRNDGIFEADASGAVRINKNECAFNIGSELKAWALVTVKNERYHKGCLAVIGKPLGSNKQALTLYDLASSGNDRVEMPVTLGNKSFLACFGRHIFTVHESVLDYFYIDKRFKLERCAIGADELNDKLEWCNGVRQKVVCDGNGNVFWIAGDGVYGFPIGSPRSLVEFGCPVGRRTSDIACYDDGLYLYSTDKRSGATTCYLYTETDGIYEPVPVNDSKANLILGKGDGFVRYVKLTDGGRSAVTAEYSFPAKSEKLDGKRLRVKDKAFCCFGALCSARYVGYDGKKKPIAIV